MIIFQNRVPAAPAAMSVQEAQQELIVRLGKQLAAVESDHRALRTKYDALAASGLVSSAAPQQAIFAQATSNAARALAAVATVSLPPLPCPLGKPNPSLTFLWRRLALAVALSATQLGLG